MLKAIELEAEIEPAANKRARHDYDSIDSANTETLSRRHATDRRVEGQPFVRLTKAEKRIQRGERAKVARAAQRKRWKERRKEAARERDLNLSPEEIASQREKRLSEARAVDEHLERAFTAGLRVAIDLSFCDSSLKFKQTNGDDVAVNTARETASLAKQLNYIYTAIRRREGNLSLHLVSYQGAAATALDAKGALGWKVHRHPEPLNEIFEARDLVYLSPDADEELEYIFLSCYV